MKARKKMLNVTICFILSLIVIFLLEVSTYASTEKLDGKNMQKVITNYKNENYTKAIKYNRKLKKYASEGCVKNMPSKIKTSYKKIISEYIKKGKMECFYLTDIDNNGMADLLIKTTGDEITMQLIGYVYKNKKAIKVGSLSGSGVKFCAYLGHNGIIRLKTVMGPPSGYGEMVSLISVVNGKLQETMVGSRLVEYNKDKGIDLRNELRAKYTL